MKNKTNKTVFKTWVMLFENDKKSKVKVFLHRIK